MKLVHKNARKTLIKHSSSRFKCIDCNG